MSRRVYLPESLEELWYIHEHNANAMVYAGGTDLLVKLRLNRIEPASLICLERIRELKMVEDRGGYLFIGSGVTHSMLLDHPLARRRVPILSRALSVLGSPPIRHMGTIGGNVVTASPAGDSLPPLYILAAEIEVVSRNGSKRVPVKDFIRGPGVTILGYGDLVRGIWIPKTDEYNVHHYEKVGQRKSQAIAVVSMAALLMVSNSGIIEKARIAWGSVGPTVIFSGEVDREMEGKSLDDRQMLQRIAGLAEQVVKPIDDVRATARYRRTVAGNLVMRLSTYAPIGAPV